jgi:hypothetical protein
MTASRIRTLRSRLPEGVTASFNYNTDEYRINFVGGVEATAYYTNDLEDALATAHLMANREGQWEIDTPADDIDPDDNCTGSYP